MAATSHDYYDVLGVPRGSSKPAIDKAYLALKAGTKLSSQDLWQVERAYATLSDPNLKRRYDLVAPQSPPVAAAAAASSQERAPAEPTALSRQVENNGSLIVAALFVVLGATFYFAAWPHMSWRFSNFAPGSVLRDRRTSQAYGTVLEYQRMHAFPHGIAAPAYRLKLPSGAESWVSRDEANQMAEPIR